MLYQTIGLSTPDLINYLGHIIQKTIEVYTSTSTQYNVTGLSFSVLQEIHAHLTPYLMNYHSVFSLLNNVIGYFGGTSSPNLILLEDLAVRFFKAGYNLLLIYRQVHLALGISLVNSPISTQM